MTNDIATRPEADGALDVLRLAVERGADVATLERLVALQERIVAQRAAAEFASAMAAFQAECPPVRKSSTAKIVTKGGGQYSYKYAELDEIAEHIRPHIGRHGLSYSFDCEHKDGMVSVTCTVRHVGGHSQTARFAAPVDREARMNATQQVGAALTYGKRQALVQALGLTTGDRDTDAVTAREEVERITAQQAADLLALATEVESSVPKILAWAQVERIEDMPAAYYPEAILTLEGKRQAKRQAKREAAS